MRIEEQKKAVRVGYEMEVLPPDIVTYDNGTKSLLEDFQSRLVLVKNPNDQKSKKEQPEDEEEQKKKECFHQTEKNVSGADKSFRNKVFYIIGLDGK